MPEALQQVRDDLGELAVILNTRQLRKGNRFNLGDEARVEVTAACDQAVDGQIPSDASPATTDPSAGGLSVKDSSGTTPSRAADPSASRVGETQATLSVDPPGNMVSRRYGRTRPQLPVRPRERGPSQTSSDDPSRMSAGTSAEAEGSLETVLAEVRRLREALARVERQRERREFLVPDAVTRLRARLSHMGLGGDLLAALTEHLFTEMSGKALAEPGRVAERAVAFLARQVPGYRDVRLGRRRKVVAFFGGAGSGKTTAAAKIAAGFTARHGRGVVLVSLTEGSGDGADHTRSLTAGLGVLSAVAHSQDDLLSVMDGHSDARLVLLDTPGCGPHDPPGRERLRRLFEAASVDEVHVVLDAKTSLEHMLDQIDAGAEMGERRLLFTKLDETARTGAVLSAAASSQVPVSYFTTGPEIPGGIAAGNCARLAARLMGISSGAAWTEGE